MKAREFAYALAEAGMMQLGEHEPDVVVRYNINGPEHPVSKVRVREGKIIIQFGEQ